MNNVVLLDENKFGTKGIFVFYILFVIIRLDWTVSYKPSNLVFTLEHKEYK